MTNPIIEALGGTKLVADELNLPVNAVANWSLTGRDIPWRRRHLIARMAADRGIALPPDFLGDAA